MVLAGPVTAASWRCQVLLPKGRYQFEGFVSCEGVTPLPFGKAHGATLRVVGYGRSHTTNLLESSPWKYLQVPFEVTSSEQQTELVCELRASKGRAWFDEKSLKLRSLP